MNKTHIFAITGARTQTTNKRIICVYILRMKKNTKRGIFVELEIIQAKHIVKINVMCMMGFYFIIYILNKRVVCQGIDSKVIFENDCL